MLVTNMSGRSMHSVFVGLVCLAIASAISGSSAGSSNHSMCLESERQALIQFKQGLVDDHNVLASWEFLADCCQWRGIACNNQTGHVITLDLSYNFLRGKIHPSLLELRYLNYLDLSSNNFGRMMIPEFIGSLSQLKVLKLAEANFSGPVPPHLGNLSNLNTLDLPLNRFVSSGNLEWLSHLSSLRYLNMSWLDLSEAVNWPQVFSKLTSLTHLRLFQCNLPDVNLKSLSLINSSTSLQVLDLSLNHLNTSIFHWISNVSTNLVDIDLSSNNLEGPIPDVFTSMLYLETLDLAWNHFEGGIPKAFQNLCSLEVLILRNNQLSGNIEDSIKAFSCAKNTLKTLALQQNQFWGSIPQLTGFAKLRYFDLSSNNLNGTLHESVGQLSSLEVLDLFGNSVTGAITESHFRNLSRLWYLNLNGNRFFVNLSSDWNPPFRLSSLGMSSCKMSPAFPKWILTQTNISYLSLSNAGISGSLPDNFWDQFPGLDQLDLSTNQISGDLTNLSTATVRSLNLSSNLFSGAVPSCSPNLSWLDLSYNKFSEPLTSICTTSSLLSSLDISHNLLLGELPNCLMQFQYLYSLNLGDNKLSGKLPSWLGSLNSLGVLRLHQNNFSGELSSLENCTKLVMVDLGDNNLSGKIPTWIGQSLTHLVVLRLHSNQFHGAIPLSLCNLATIHVLDLSHNNISGALPHCFNNITAFARNIESGSSDLGFNVELVWKGIEIEFGQNLKRMRSIDVSSNYLVGELPQSIVSMTELISLNLSRNYLTGKLPEDFGNMKMLESLDLSRNNLSGSIPASFSRLNYLGVLDVSHNHLSGRIPVGTQLQSFNASAYSGNLGLCGPPLTPNCSANGTTRAENNKDPDNDGLLNQLGFIISTMSGFISGFWIVCGSLLLKRSWRNIYFKFLDDSRDWINVKIDVYKARVQRSLQR